MKYLICSDVQSKTDDVNKVKEHYFSVGCSMSL